MPLVLCEIDNKSNQQFYNMIKQNRMENIRCITNNKKNYYCTKKLDSVKYIQRYEYMYKDSKLNVFLTVDSGQNI